MNYERIINDKYQFHFKVNYGYVGHEYINILDLNELINNIKSDEK